MKTRLKTKLTLRFAAILSITTLGLGIYTFVQSQKDIDELLDRSILGTTAHIDGQIAGPLKNAENSSRMIAEVTKPTIEVDRATSVNSTTFPKLSSYLTELIRINADLSSTSVVLDRTGESIRAVRQKDGSIVVTTSILIEDGRTVRRNLAPAGARFRELSSSVGNLIDQRILPIYEQVKETRELAWSGIRVLHPADGIEVPGITCATPIIGPGGEFIGTAMVDLTVGDISRYLQTLQVSNNGYAFLAETSPNGARLAAHPDPHRLLTSSGGAQRIVSLAEMDDPLLTLIVDMIETEAAEISQGRTVQRHLLLNQEDWRIGIQKISGTRTPPWTICIVIPESDFAAPLKETLGVFITALGGALLFGIGAIFWLSQMMTRSASFPSLLSG
jgi:adenylate cyclase